MPQLFRFESESCGIYEAVEKHCPRSDPRRHFKPDGAWLARVGTRFPGATSFWTEAGLKRYLDSGLQDWHRRVVREPLRVKVVRSFNPDRALYTDEHQVIAPREALFEFVEDLSWEEFALERAQAEGQTVREKVVAYLIRPSDSKILVFEHDKEFSEAGLQVPAGSVDSGESLAQAVERECLEEVGVNALKIIKQVDAYVLYRNFQAQFQRRHVFWGEPLSQLPESWTHTVSGGGSDDGFRFHCSWMNLNEARLKLAGGFGDSISKLF